MSTWIAFLIFITLNGRATAAPMSFTSNAICTKNHCINPVFPGLTDLERLSSGAWMCATSHDTRQWMDFCRGAVYYDPALPSGGSGVGDIVKAQEKAAITMFYYHLNAMGIEAWDHRKPEDSNDCIRSVWRMVCYTYFPRQPRDCKKGESTKYLRPCSSSCANYVRNCKVECCDESVQCVFKHEKVFNDHTTVLTHGYVNDDGPSEHCTGAATRSAAKPGGLWLLLLAAAFARFGAGGDALASVGRQVSGARSRTLLFLAVLAVAALSLQGCGPTGSDIEVHTIGNWRGEPDYLMKFEYFPKGKSWRQARLNSCGVKMGTGGLQCSGRGQCMAFEPDNLGNPFSLCKCNRDWADPECRTPRKSQMHAYFVSLLFGYLGADQFYLGFPMLGFLKLITLGGCGLWYLIDVIRIGSAPVYAHNFRTAADLPHWVFVLVTVMFVMTIGFLITGYFAFRWQRKRREFARKLMDFEEARAAGELPAYSGVDRTKNGRYGAPKPSYAFTPQTTTSLWAESPAPEQ